MPHSKKVVKQKEQPKGKNIRHQGNPDGYYQETPSWCFNSSDAEKWVLTRHKDLFWSELLPRLNDLESQTWDDILLKAKKHNHSVQKNALNKVAVDRLADLHIELESIISLKINATHRLYGYIVTGRFHILWYDIHHGESDTCVCPSRKKHT